MIHEAFNKKYNFNKKYLILSNDRFYYTIKFDSTVHLEPSIFSFEIDDIQRNGDSYQIKTPRTSLLRDLGLDTFTLKEETKVRANRLYIDALLNYEEMNYIDLLDSFFLELSFTKTQDDETKKYTLHNYEITLLDRHIFIRLQKSENRLETSFYFTQKDKWLNPNITSGYCTDLALFDQIIEMIRYLWKY